MKLDRKPFDIAHKKAKEVVGRIYFTIKKPKFMVDHAKKSNTIEFDHFKTERK